MGEGNTHVNILSIVGMGGSGKTTLARKLYNHPYTKECFNCMAWVFISQEWSVQHILSEILRMVGNDINHRGSHELQAKFSSEELVDMLRNILKNKSYLVVLDDVWRREAVEQILPALPLDDTNRGSKIIITTRNREIIHFQNLWQEMYVHEPQPLSDEEGWELFSKLALGLQTDSNMEEKYKSLGKVMLKNCGGLPLAIVALAGILKTRGSIRDWQLVNEAIRTRVMKGLCSNMDGSVQDLLALSYEDLPYYLKPCFLYLGLFPEDCQIPAGMLTRMWIAEGLVTAQEELSVEDVALQYLEELSHRCMIQVAQTNYQGAIKAFLLHDLLRDLCLRIAKEQSFLQVYTNDQSMSTFAPTMAIPPRRAALHSCFSMPIQDSKLRSIVMLTRSSLLPSAYVSQVTVDFGLVHDNFKLLRLLNLWGIKTEDGTMPKQIGSLIHLRYLGIRASNIKELPWSIGKLRNLLTLDYRNIESDNIKIPDVFRKLVLLRNLFLPLECTWRTLDDMNLRDLKNLRILWGIRSDGRSDGFVKEMAGLSATVKKLKAVVSTEKDLEAIFSCPNITSHQLLTLHCQWGDAITLRHVNPVFGSSQHLSKLVLIGKIQVKQLSHILPPNLVVLELEESVAKDEDPMLAIGALAHLKFLRFSNSYLGTTFQCNIGSFLVLEELRLENLHNLEKWVIAKGAMLNLKKLQISNCRKLQHFPKGLSSLSTLQLFEFIGVPNDFVQEATKFGWSRKRFRLPHNFDAIIEQCDSPVDFSSMNKLYEQLKVGVFLKSEKQRYWVMEQNEQYYNCFKLSATSLSVHQSNLYDEALPSRVVKWNDDNFSVNEWFKKKESDGTSTMVLKINRSELIVSGAFLLSNLSPEVTYQVVCVIMMPDPSLSTKSCASFKFLLSTGLLQMQNHKMYGKPTDVWIELLISEFNTPPRSSGEKMEFRLTFNSLVGLIIKGIIIKPKL